MENNLGDELEAKVEEHEHYQGSDFMKAQVLLWVAISASVFSALNATGLLEPHIPKWIGVILAALPGAVILIDKTFKHAARSSWHALYKTRLNTLKRDLRDRGGDIKEVSERLSELEVDMEKLFPPLESGFLGRRE